MRRGITENLLNKQNAHGDIIGLEVIELSKLNKEDMKKLPEEVKVLLRESASRLAIVSHPH